MKKLLITGGARLSGTVRIHGAKNSVLPVLAACCLCTSPCVLHNCPDIEDVRTALAILESLGCKTRREGSTLCIDPSGLSRFRVSMRPAFQNSAWKSGWQEKCARRFYFWARFLQGAEKRSWRFRAGARWESGQSIYM